MGPTRVLRSRKKAEKEVDHNVSLVSQPKSLDWWENFTKRFTGSLSRSKNSATFESIFKISRGTFSYICSLVKDEMMVKPTNFANFNRQPLCHDERVAIALRRLSSGESLSAIGDSFGMSQTTVAQITRCFVEAVEKKGIHHLQWPSSETEIEVIKSKFEDIRGLPNCCGAIGTTRIKMSLSTVDKSNEIWYDNEHKHSMILEAIVDPDMRFLDIVTGWPGSFSDTLALKHSTFFKLCEEGKRLNGKKIQLSQGTELREYIVGDAGFPLLPWLLTPHQGTNLSEHEGKFNTRHAATRMVAQRALARLKETWKIIDGVMWRPDKKRLPRIILVCCLLHNIVIDLDDQVQKAIPFSHDDHGPEYSQQICDSVDENAAAVREKLSLHLFERVQP